MHTDWETTVAPLEYYLPLPSSMATSRTPRLSGGFSRVWPDDMHG